MQSSLKPWFGINWADRFLFQYKWTVLFWTINMFIFSHADNCQHIAYILMAF